MKHGLLYTPETRVWEAWVQGRCVGSGPDKPIIEAAYEHHLADTGVAMIGAERLRQLPGGEGWTFDHDDHHVGGELAAAAYSYLAAYCDPLGDNGAPAEWPWDASWWKPTPGPIRMLVKAGALIAAEIDRLHRAGETQ